MHLRSVVFVLTISAACLRQGAHPERAAFGAWRVTSSICPTDCALSRSEADAWRGRAATYRDSLARFADDSCKSPHYNVGHWPADGRYGGATLAQLGVIGDSVMVIEVQCPAQRRTGSDPRWQVPGAFLIVKDRDHLLMVWEGVFFGLTRTEK